MDLKQAYSDDKKFQQCYQSNLLIYVIEWGGGGGI